MSEMRGMNELRGLILIGMIVFLSGCINLGGGGISSYYKNDVITVENYVAETEPVPGGVAIIKFDVMNNGDRTVPKAVVNFFDTKGLKTTVKCNGGFSLSDSSCEYDNIPSLESRSFTITFQIPSKEDIQGPIKLAVNYEIAYNYQGARRMTLPIIDPSVKQPLTQYSISDPSIGPIVADFDAPVGRTTVQNNQQVKEYWGIKGNSFQIKMKFSSVASSTVGDMKPVNLTAGKISLKLNGVSVDQNRRCDFRGSTGTIYSSYDITVSSNSGTFGISGTPSSGGMSMLVCNFIPANFPQLYKTIAIDANFQYEIQILRSETFAINPQQAPSGSQSQTGSGNQGGNFGNI